MLDCTYRVQIRHHAGQLARVAQAIADGEGLIGDVVTVSLGREHSIRDITVEVRDIPQSDRIAELRRRARRREGAVARGPGAAPPRRRQAPDRRRAAGTDGSGDARRVHPGVARVCTAIAEQPELAARYTMISRSVAICTNGTRVLGLGNIGPVASMPVMEGKAVFYDQFVGISAMPILIDATDVDDVRQHRAADRADVRRDPPRGHLGARVLRDRAAAEGGAAAAGHARRRPRHRGGVARRRDGRVPLRRDRAPLGDRRPARARRRRVRDRGADGRRGRAPRDRVRSARGIARPRARARCRDQLDGAGDGGGRRGRGDDRSRRADPAGDDPPRPGDPRPHQPRPRDRARGRPRPPAPRSRRTAAASTTCSATPASSAARCRPGRRGSTSR